MDATEANFEFDKERMERLKLDALRQLKSFVENAARQIDGLSHGNRKQRRQATYANRRLAELEEFAVARINSLYDQTLSGVDFDHCTKNGVQDEVAARLAAIFS